MEAEMLPLWLPLGQHCCSCSLLGSSLSTPQVSALPTRNSKEEVSGWEAKPSLCFNTQNPRPHLKSLPLDTALLESDVLRWGLSWWRVLSCPEPSLIAILASTDTSNRLHTREHFLSFRLTTFVTQVELVRFINQ